MDDGLRFRAFYQGIFIYKTLVDANYYTKDGKCIALANTLPNTVVWFNGAWWLKSEPSQAMYRENEETYAEFEVIGNIHENKELLR